MSPQQFPCFDRETARHDDEGYEQRYPLTYRNNALKKNDLRTEWPHEAQDFTPWLEKNINALSLAIDVPIQVEGREVSIGRFRADLVGQEIRSECLVIIENQLNKTDHEHLGKLLTYAAGIDAKVLVWVAPEFCPEHRNVLEWLNKKLTNIYCFGVEVELFQDFPLNNTPEYKQLTFFDSDIFQVEDLSQFVQISPQKLLKIKNIVAPKTIVSPSPPLQNTRQSPPFRPVRSQHYVAPSKSPQFVRQSREPRQYYQKTNSRRSSLLGVLPYILGGVGVIFSLAMLWHSPHAGNPELNME